MWGGNLLSESMTQLSLFEFCYLSQTIDSELIPMTKQFLVAHQELRVYQAAFEAAMQIFELAQGFPETERMLLTEPMLQASRSLCVHVAKAWRRRRDKGAFIARLNAAESEAAATQTWVEFAIMCTYLNAEIGQALYQQYAEILIGLNRLIESADAWVIAES